MKLITQEHTLGCAVACVASLLGISYKEALSLFDKPEKAWTKGFYCRELCKALSKKGLAYKWKKVDDRNQRLIKTQGSIVFISQNSIYPAGHFLLKTTGGYMNSWKNFPAITPAKAGYDKKLPGKPSYIIFPQGKE